MKGKAHHLKMDRSNGAACGMSRQGKVALRVPARHSGSSTGHEQTHTRLRTRKVAQRASLWDRNKLEELSSLSTPTSPRGGVKEEPSTSTSRAGAVRSTIGSLANTAKTGVVGGLVGGWQVSSRGMVTLMRSLSLTLPFPTFQDDGMEVPAAYYEPSGGDAPQASTDEEEVPEKPVVNVKSFLRNESNQVQKLKMMRMLSSMSEQAYYVNTLTDADVWKRYGLNLVTSSKEYRTSKCSSSFSEEVDVNAFSVFDEGDGMAVPITCLPDDTFRSDQKLDSEYEEVTKPDTSKPSVPNQPADLVNSRIAAASKALEFATKNLATFVTGYNKSVPKQEPSSSQSATDPCEWLVADDPNKPVRYIALQGSDSVDHWVTNLSFGPVDFEEKDLLVKIHSGVYKAAEKLFSQLGAAILDHIATYGKNARFIFTGHSLGGAIGIALVLLLVKREVISASMIEGIYTYGCPGFIYNDCSQASEGQKGDLLQDLGIDENVIHNVCMHRDIVPRAFSCDYGSVRFILQQLEGFKNHSLLSGEDSKIQMETLYHHLGNMYFLQPDSDFLTFANPEGDHPMFPRKPGLYKMVEPPASLKMAMNTVNMMSRMLQNEWAFADTVDYYDYARDMNHAVVEILNTPHPLEVLKETAAWGHHGAVSRFHKPKNYTRALGALLYVKND